MTLQEYQDQLHALYQGDADTPTSTDDEWAHRLSLLKTGIGVWNAEKGVLWNELWKQLSDAGVGAGTGDKTVNAGDLVYATPTDFRFPGTFVRTTDSAGNNTYWEVISQQKAQLYLGAGLKACYFTGNTKDSFNLNFLTQPTAGHTINYPYYKTPYIPTVAASVIEMSDPYFAIYFSLSKMHEIDGEGDRSIKAFSEAQAKLNGMKTANIMPAWYQDNAVPDRDYETGTGGFGV